MSKKWAVSTISFHDNVLKTSIVDANTWEGALCSVDDGYEWIIDQSCGDIDKAKEIAFDGDFMFEVIEIQS